MNIFLKSLIYFAGSFVVTILIYVLFINRNRKEYVEGKKQVDIIYIVKRFDLDMRKTKYKTVRNWVTVINSFIMSFTFTVIINLEINYFLKLAIAFIILMILIYSLYEIIGRVLKKKQKDDVST